MSDGQPTSLLVVNNAPFGLDAEGARCVEPATGDFLAELAARVPHCAIAQGWVDFGDEATPNTYATTRCPGLRTTSVPWRIDSRKERLLSYVRALPWILRETWRADALYVFHPGHLSTIFTLVARALGRPYGIYLRGELHEPWLERVAGHARFVLVANEGLRELCARHATDTSLVAPMIDLRESDIVAPRPAKPSGPFRLLFVGRLEEPKGLGELIPAIAEVQRAGIELEVDLVGWETEPGIYPELAASVGAANVRFRGVISDRAELRSLFASADLFVLPTHTEGFPRVLHEAMALGVPILTTFVGGIPAVMTDGENCLEIPVRDGAGLARVLERALREPALRERIAAGGNATSRRVLGGDRPTHAGQVAERILALD